MNHNQNNSNEQMAEASPLFASVWLALYYELRKSYQQRRLMTTEPETASTTENNPSIQ